MLASRSLKPKLSLSISTATQATKRPTLNLPSPIAMAAPLQSPISPTPVSPTARNTRLNQRGYSTMQQPTFSYANYSSTKSILKKGQTCRAPTNRRLQFRDEPTIHAITPIENEEEYYGTNVSRDERRWGKR